MSEPGPFDVGKRRGESFAASDLYCDEAYRARILESHRRAVLEENDRWCAEYSRGFLAAAEATA